MAKEVKKETSLHEVGYQYLIDNPSLEFVYVTSDKSIFVGTPGGENSAINHSKTLEVKDILKVTK